jgi:DNA-binding NarL/FixJ family response regulator
MPDDKAIRELPVVLLLDDTVAGQTRFKDLIGHRFQVAIARTVAEFKELYAKMVDQHKPPQAVVIDLVISPEEPPEGLSLISELRSTHRNLPIVAWSKFSERYADEALRLGANKVVTKHENDKNLADFLEQMISH